MTKLAETYARIKPSIVAIISRLSRQPDFPEIVGTGFIAREDGLIFTCQHVIKALGKLPKRKGAPEDEWPALAFLFHFIPNKGMALVPLDIKAVMPVAGMDYPGVYYGPDIPDVGIIRVAVKDLPPLSIAERPTLYEGQDVAISGFPMGTATLKAPGWVHQVSPTLQRGIISCILPFPCDTPHGLLLDLMSKEGSSGSPVFGIDTGEVIGMVDAGLYENKTIVGKDGVFIYKNSTTLTTAVASHFMHTVLTQIDSIPGFKEHKIEMESLQSLISDESRYRTLTPKEPTLQATDIERLCKLSE